MTIIVEDGSAKPDAQTFCTVGLADAWHLARGITTWATLSEAEKEQALVRAAGFMEQIYRLRWKGYRVSDSQSLSWPRTWVEVMDGPIARVLAANIVPIQVQQANAELALKAAAADLLPDVDRAAHVTREKVDVLEVEYGPGAASAAVTRRVSVDLMLAEFLTAGGGAHSFSVARA